jgi:hypothetical protein
VFRGTIAEIAPFLTAFTDLFMTYSQGSSLLLTTLGGGCLGSPYGLLIYRVISPLTGRRLLLKGVSYSDTVKIIKAEELINVITI